MLGHAVPSPSTCYIVTKHMSRQNTSYHDTITTQPLAEARKILLLLLQLAFLFAQAQPMTQGTKASTA